MLLIYRKGSDRAGWGESEEGEEGGQCIGYLVPQYDAPTAYSFSRSDAAASVYG